MNPATLREIAAKLRDLEHGRCSRAAWEVFTVSVFRDFKAVIGYALELEEKLEDAQHRLHAVTPIEYDGAETVELPALQSSDLLYAEPVRTQELEDALEALDESDDLKET